MTAGKGSWWDTAVGKIIPGLAPRDRDESTRSADWRRGKVVFLSMGSSVSACQLSIFTPLVVSHVRHILTLN